MVFPSVFYRTFAQFSKNRYFQTKHFKPSKQNFLAATLAFSRKRTQNQLFQLAGKTTEWRKN